MSIVNFAIPRTLDIQVRRAIKSRGFASKAEFFRMAAISYLSVKLPGHDSVNVPTYYLKGKAAEKLDREYDRAMAELKAGKAIRANSLMEAMEKFDGLK